MIDTVLFDMDGLLLDTEPLWGESMLRIAKKHNVPITADKFKETTGLRIYEVTEYWSYKYPWQGISSYDLAEEILDDIIELAKEKGRVMPGVLSLLQLLKNRNYKIGLASSSPARMINDLVTHFKIKDYFEVIVSADVVEFGKPHPGVFIYAAKELESNPLKCLVLEDSINGMLAAKSARMKVVMVPDEAHYERLELVLADMKLPTLENFNLDLLNNL